MPEPVDAGRILGARYCLDHLIARGGMGTVWAAEDPLLSRTVAVKVLDPVLGGDETVRARFRREAVAAAALTHPNIVATYDTGEDGDIAYIVMELVQGTTLRQVIDAEAPLPIARAADIAWQVADAIATAHAQNLIHRDVKPSNVLVQPDGRVRVTDFGIAKAADSAESELTRSGTVVGTARYLAPEQVDGGPIDPRADVYALGLVLYEMLVGHAPFQGDSDIATAVARLTSTHASVLTERPDVPPGLADLVDRSLEREPDRRLPSAVAFRDALDGFRFDAGTDPRADPTVPVRLPPKPATPGGSPRVDPTRTAVVSPAAIRTPIARAALVWVSAFLLGAVGGFLGWRALDDNDPTPRQVPTATVAPLPIVAVSDFDPEGDGAESPDEVGAVIDANVATVWSTERYFSRDVGGAKRGVGLVFELAGPGAVSRVEVITPDTDWSASVYVADAPGESLEAWGPAVGGGTGLTSPAQIAVEPTVTGRAVLLWITGLPATNRLRVAQVQILGPA